MEMEKEFSITTSSEPGYNLLPNYLMLEVEKTEFLQFMLLIVH